MSRPRSIVLFEWIMAFAQLLRLINVLLTWRHFRLAETAPIRAFLLIAILGAVTFLLLWLASRRASRVAVLLLVILAAYNALMIEEALTSGAIGLDPMTVSMLVATGSMIAALALLMRRDARDWLAGRPPVNPDIFA